MAGVDPRELRDLVVELRGEIARVRSEVTRSGDDLGVVRSRVDDLLVAVHALAEVEERRTALEHEREAARADERQVERELARTREADRSHLRRSILDRVIVPLVTAALAVAGARATSPSSPAEPEPATGTTEVAPP